MSLVIYFKLLNPAAVAPVKMTEGSAGYDLSVPRETILSAGVRTKVPLGWAMEFPKGYGAFIRPRSSLFLAGLTIEGVIDSDYREGVNLMVEAKRDMTFEAGTRIAQLFFLLVETVEFQNTTVLTPSGRSGGFGSTGQR